MILPEEVRKHMSDDAVGKVVSSLEYEAEDTESGPYWVMTFEDGSEICFRTMAELVNP